MAQCQRLHLSLQEMQVWSLSQENTLEKEMAAHSSILSGKIPGTEKTGGLKPMGWQRSDYDQVTEHACIHDSV